MNSDGVHFRLWHFCDIELEVALEDATLRDEALGILRALVERVDIHPIADGFDIDFVGEIVKMIGLPASIDGGNLDKFRVSAKRVAGACNRRYLQLAMSRFPRT
jgi:hypothetical protein